MENRPDLIFGVFRSFQAPQFLWLAAAIPLVAIAAWLLRRRWRHALPLPSASLLGARVFSFRVAARRALPALHALAMLAVVAALARPAITVSRQVVVPPSLDLVIAIDLSSSMMAGDLPPNRIEAAKQLAVSLLRERPDDRAALVAFAGEAVTMCPLTMDHEALAGLIGDLQPGLLPDGTAIGDALALGVARLPASSPRRRAIILMTDGSQTRGGIMPAEAARVAAENGVPIYTIGLGTKGPVPYPLSTPGGVLQEFVSLDLDEATLSSIAAQSGGAWYRATSGEGVARIARALAQSVSGVPTVETRAAAVDLSGWTALVALVLFVAAESTVAWLK